MSKGFTMKFLSRLRKRWRAGVATIIAGSMLAGGLSAAFAVDGEGDGHGLGGGREGSTDVAWYYKENFGSLSDQTVANFLFNTQGLHKLDGADRIIHDAVQETIASINRREPGSSAHARITGIGFRWGLYHGVKNFGSANNDGYANNPQLWHDRFTAATSGKYWNYRGTNYNANTNLGGGRTINTVGAELTSRANNVTELEIIALAEDEPQVSYHVDVSTTAHPGNMYLRNNEPVYDTVHTRVTKGQWPAGNRLGATVWLNYEPGQGASAQPAKAVRHDFTIDHVGDTNTPDRDKNRLSLRITSS